MLVLQGGGISRFLDRIPSFQKKKVGALPFKYLGLPIGDIPKEEKYERLMYRLLLRCIEPFIFMLRDKHMTDFHIKWF